MGPVNGTSRKEICCNWIDVRQADINEVEKHFFQAKTTVKETNVKEVLTTLYNQEFTERASPAGKLENGMSVEDVKFMKILEDGANMVNKPYQNSLPFRYQEWLRLLYLQKRSNRNKEFENDYVRFM